MESSTSSDVNTSAAFNLTPATTLDPETQARVDYYNSISLALRLYVTPFIIIYGTVGNIITIVVVLSRRFRSSPTSILLLALAIVDTGALYFNLLDIWLATLLGGNSLQFVRDQGPVGCKISVFLTYFLTHSSSWILVLINIDRVISVYQPLKARTWCTRRRLAVALLLMFVLLALISLHVFWSVTYFTEYETYKCQLDSAVLGAEGESTWLHVDATLFTFLPFIIILSCNIAIIVALVAAQRRRSDMSGGGGGGQQDTTSITTMLVTISVVFLLTTTPLTLCYQFFDQITEKYKYDPVGYALYFELLINTFLVLLCYNNNAVNFLLYCISGSKFRRALVEMCGCGRQQRQRGGGGESYITNTTMASRSGAPGNHTRIYMTDLKTVSAGTAGEGRGNGSQHPHSYVNNDYVA